MPYKLILYICQNHKAIFPSQYMELFGFAMFGRADICLKDFIKSNSWNENNIGNGMFFKNFLE